MKLLQERIQLLSYPIRQKHARTTTAQRLALTELDGVLLRKQVARLRDDDVARVRGAAPRHLLAHLAASSLSTPYSHRQGGGGSHFGFVAGEDPEQRDPRVERVE